MIFPSYHRLSLNFFLTLVPILYRDMIRVCDRVCGPGVAVGMYAVACCSVPLVVFPGLTSLFFGSLEATVGASSFCSCLLLSSCGWLSWLDLPVFWKTGSYGGSQQFLEFMDGMFFSKGCWDWMCKGICEVLEGYGELVTRCG